MAQDAQLETCLKAERDALRACVDILQAEEQSLARGETELLPQLAAQKAALLSSLGDHSRTRERLVAQGGFPPGKEGMTALLQAHPSFAAQWKEIMDWSHQARDLNQINGEMIHVRLGRTSQALAILTNGGKAPSNLYGRDGHLQASTAARPLGSA
jgi:flagella synthesis protein FlgN